MLDDQIDLRQHLAGSLPADKVNPCFQDLFRLEKRLNISGKTWFKTEEHEKEITGVEEVLEQKALVKGRLEKCFPKVSMEKKVTNLNAHFNKEVVPIKKKVADLNAFLCKLH